MMIVWIYKNISLMFIIACSKRGYKQHNFIFSSFKQSGYIPRIFMLIKLHKSINMILIHEQGQVWN